MWRLTVIAGFLWVSPGANAQRLDWKPTDFAPLTSIPWEKPFATVDEVLRDIYHEPDGWIRQVVLRAFLNEVPVEKLEDVWKRCVALEGTQDHSRLAEMILTNWGGRDPEGAVAKFRKLRGICLRENDVLGLDSWESPAIEVLDLAAFRASPWYLGGVPDGLASTLNGADLPYEKRVSLLEEFSSLYIRATGNLPHSSAPRAQESTDETRTEGEFLEVLRRHFDVSLQFLKPGAKPGYTAPGLEAGFVRWLAIEPKNALRILEVRAEHDNLPDCPDNRFLLHWMKADFPAMLQWAEKQPAESRARALLLSRVDEPIRAKWLREAAESKKDEGAITSGALHELISTWAQWDPAAALKAAVETRAPLLIREAAEEGAFGAFHAFNGSGHGLGVVRDFDLDATAALLPEERREELFSEWGITIMEQWSYIDVGEAARNGFKVLNTSQFRKLVPRENLIRLFSGDDEYASDADMIDRTFCALRFWAHWKPEEARQWIATVEEAEMRTALTWLLEHAGQHIPQKEKKQYQ